MTKGFAAADVRAYAYSRDARRRTQIFREYGGKYDLEEIHFGADTSDAEWTRERELFNKACFDAVDHIEALREQKAQDEQLDDSGIDTGSTRSSAPDISGVNERYMRQHVDN